MTHDPICDWQQKQCKDNCIPASIGNHCSHMWCQCELIAMIRADEYQKFISTTNKTWAIQANKSKRELAIVRAQRDLLAKKSGLPIPNVNGEEYL